MTKVYNKIYPWECEEVNFNFDRGYSSNKFEDVSLKFRNQETSDTSEVKISKQLTFDILNRSSIFDDCAFKINKDFKEETKDDLYLPEDYKKGLREELAKPSGRDMSPVGDWEITSINDESEIKVNILEKKTLNSTSVFLDESEFSEYFSNEININPKSTLASMVEENIDTFEEDEPND